VSYQNEEIILSDLIEFIRQELKVIDFHFKSEDGLHKVNNLEQKIKEIFIQAGVDSQVFSHNKNPN
jgi:hypothetical protein